MSKTPDDWKSEGNKALQAHNYDESIKCYSEAIKAAKQDSDPQKWKVHIYYSNRSAAHAHKKEFLEAVEDAEECCREARSRDHNFVKGYSRMGAALYGLGKYAQAEAAYKDGLQIDSRNAVLLQGLEQLKPHLSGPASSQPVDNPFGDPNSLMEKLQRDPETAAYFQDPAFRAMANDLGKDPSAIMKHMNDPRMQKILKVATGLDLGAMGQEVNRQAKGASSGKFNGNTPKPETMKRSEAESNKSTSSEPKKSKKEDAKNDAMDTNDDSGKTEDQKTAAAEKALGTECYKKKNFEKALEHYGKAKDLDPKNPVYLGNIAAVYLESKEYQKCRDACDEGVNVARDNGSDFKTVAKLIARIGTSYEREGLFEDAMTWYQKSLTESRDPAVKTKMDKLKKKTAEAKKKAYLSDEKFAESKEMAKQHFISGDFSAAMRSYSDCLERKCHKDKNNHKPLSVIYSNLAGCHHKRLEWAGAVAQADKAIELDPTFVKAYLRKAAAMTAWGRHYQAIKVFKDAERVEEQLLADKVIEFRTSQVSDGLRDARSKWREIKRSNPDIVKKAAETDPQVQSILNDPAMRMILEDIQKSPAALQEHSKEPIVREKLDILLEVGVLGMR